MSKLLKISTVINGSHCQSLFKYDCPNLIEAVGEVSDKEFHDALNKIVVWFACSEGKHTVEVDVCKLEAMFAPPVEMTIEEIEKELGHRVKIVKGGAE